MKGYFSNIEKATKNNTFFLKVLFTTKKSQLVIMSLKPGEEIGEETHEQADQFFRIEGGEAKFILNNKEKHIAKDGDSMTVPAGIKHNVINNSKRSDLKLYTVYSRPTHPAKEKHKTKEEADAAEE